MRPFLFALLLGLPALLSAQDHPNILYILVDDLGYGDLSSFGGEDIQTPQIDALVESGMKFTNFYTNSTVCSPTRAALLSGRYPDRVGVPGVVRPYASGNFGFLDPGAMLLPEVLKAAGYQTALIGKWHLGLASPNLPNDRGFDYFRGHLSGMMDYYTHRQHQQVFLRENETEIDPEGHATDLFTSWTDTWLQAQRDPDKPFFLYLAYTAPHDPIQPPEEWLTKVLALEPGIDSARARLVALIEHLDDGVGQVLDRLEAEGLRDNTLVVFSSDNGGALRFAANNGPLRGGKQDLYEGGIKVAACASWPGVIPAGSVSAERILTMDWFPTLCGWAGVTPYHEIDGADLRPLLQGEAQDLSDRSLVWMRREGFAMMGMAYYAVRQGRYKLLQNRPGAPFELFDLEADPSETTPLDPEAHPQAYNQLRNALRQHLQAAGAVPWQGR